MAPTPIQHETFIVRLVGEQTDDGNTHWRGQIEHVQSSRLWRVATLDELALLIIAALHQQPPLAPDAEHKT